MASYPYPIVSYLGKAQIREKGRRRNLREMPFPSTEHLLICITCYYCSGCVVLGRKLTAISCNVSNLSCNLPRSSCFIWIVNPARMASRVRQDRTGRKEHLLLHRSFQSCSRKSFKGAAEGNNTRLTHSLVAEPHGSCSDGISDEQIQRVMQDKSGSISWLVCQVETALGKTRAVLQEQQMSRAKRKLWKANQNLIHQRQQDYKGQKVKCHSSSGCAPSNSMVLPSGPSLTQIRWRYWSLSCRSHSPELWPFLLLCSGLAPLCLPEYFSWGFTKEVAGCVGPYKHQIVFCSIFQIFSADYTPILECL